MDFKSKRFGAKTVVLKETTDPRDFFSGSRGLRVTNMFDSEIVAQAQPQHRGYKFNLMADDLCEPYYDDNILRHLEGEFDISSACAVKSELLTPQMQGEVGFLDTFGRPSILFTKKFVLSMVYDRLYGRWICAALPKRAAPLPWPIGTRVFTLVSHDLC